MDGPEFTAEQKARIADEAEQMFRVLKGVCYHIAPDAAKLVSMRDPRYPIVANIFAAARESVNRVMGTDGVY